MQQSNRRGVRSQLHTAELEVHAAHLLVPSTCHIRATPSHVSSDHLSSHAYLLTNNRQLQLALWGKDCLLLKTSVSAPQGL